MATLSAFLHPVSANQEKEVIISTRFQDEQGNPVPFVIRALSQEENERMVKQCTRRVKERGQTVDFFDKTAYSHQLILQSVKSPDFTQKDICDFYGVVDPALVPGKMLLTGEYNRLLDEIMDISGFQSPEEIGEEAKN